MLPTSNLGRLALLAVLPVVLLTACEKSVPAPWSEMGFPIRHGEILPGASAENLQVKYAGQSVHEDMFREFKSKLVKAGYEYMADAKDHDMAGNIRSVIMKKGAIRLKLTVSGRGMTMVRIKRVD